ncbi:MAG: S41 family peptidase [Fimbriimonadaceae bacterium]|nr:S41 family peptidase [Fimbriimonadaceae bacterium]
MIENLITQMNENYVLPEIAEKIERELTTWMQSDEYKGLNDPIAFAAKVNEIIGHSVTDAHLRFQYSAQPLPQREAPGEPSEAEIRAEQQMIRYGNAEFERVERLAGNIGYIKFNRFRSPLEMYRPLQGAMYFLQHTEAMIIDLRTNGGGDPRGVQLFCSSFFSGEPVLLNTIQFRGEEKPREFWTLKELNWERYEAPIYVLVSRRTGSGAEECAYNIQQLKRGPIIGEPTWGGANPGGVVRLDDHFACFIPVGMAINPYTKTNWEGTGVIPDVACDPANSLKDTHVLALENLIKNEVNSEHRSLLERALESVKSAN